MCRKSNLAIIELYSAIHGEIIAIFDKRWVTQPVKSNIDGSMYIRSYELKETRNFEFTGQLSKRVYIR